MMHAAAPRMLVANGNAGMIGASFVRPLSPLNHDLPRFAGEGMERHGYRQI